MKQPNGPDAPALCEGHSEPGRFSAAAVAAISALLIIPFGGMSVIFVLHAMFRIG